MKPRELANLGVPRGEAMKIAGEACAAAAESGLYKTAIRQTIAELVANPEAYAGDPHFGLLSAAIVGAKPNFAGCQAPSCKRRCNSGHNCGQNPQHQGEPGPFFRSHLGHGFGRLVVRAEDRRFAAS